MFSNRFAPACTGFSSIHHTDIEIDLPDVHGSNLLVGESLCNGAVKIRLKLLVRNVRAGTVLTRWLVFLFLCRNRHEYRAYEHRRCSDREKRLPHCSLLLIIVMCVTAHFNSNTYARAHLT